MRRRLQRLFHLGKVDRPKSQIDYYHAGGSREIVYALPSRKVQRFYLEHALLTSEIALAFHRACRRPQYSKIAILDEPQIEQSLKFEGQCVSDPFQWHIEITRQLRIGVRPDRVLQIALRDEALPSFDRATFFIEADRGTMPITRTSLEQTSLLRKFFAYQSSWAQGLHRRRFGILRFRVLIVTDKARIKNMVEACQRLERGHRLFLFADREAFISSPDVFILRLLNGKGEPDSLLSSSGLRSLN